MKKIIFKSLFILLTTFLLTSCNAKLYGGMSNSGVLSSNNFRYIHKNLQGKSQATYILGVGGFNRQSIVNEAKENMLAYAPLEPNQALVNVVVDFKKTRYLFFFKKLKCYVSGDIVQFQ
ncbi:DUF6567 family protein [Polaribacter sp. Asnod1-A03]|uniref:DUF6567 family protein n=1 Tax=Polaribacter sp. Asnod1-A03 TaxID=3160581 RepID=UPI003869D3FF